MSRPVVVVTGGGRGIGRAVCERFAADGGQVVAAARSTDQLQQTQALVQEAGGQCHIRATDVCEANEIDGLMGEAVDRFGRIDVLVNNAGVGVLVKIEELTPSVFNEIMSVNVEAVYHACRAVWTVMRKQGGGVIVNISSVASLDPFPGFAAYGAAKAWVNLWSKALADEGRPHGIRVFAVAPGAVETQMLRGAFPDFPSSETLQPSDVANVVHSLAQPACRYASGQTVVVKR
ncbi:MAG: SDR family oxidoreductase [Phycisphaerae bacterium]|jgi:NAD(P)-dependent dehydrogenase (short-subunit alcohol dehydrogenase family)